MKQRLERALEVAMDAMKDAICRRPREAAVEILEDTLREIDAILHPVEVIEEEVVRYVLFYPDGTANSRTFTQDEIANASLHPGAVLVPAKHTIRREKKVVERAVSGEVVWRNSQGRTYPVGKDINFDWESIIGKTGKFTFEWTE